MNRLIITIVFLLVIACQLFAQSFTSAVKSTTVGVDDRFEVSFTYSGNEINRLKNFHPPDFNNFIVLSGPNYSTSMQIINGAVSASQTQNFIVKPKAVGKYVINSATIEYAGTLYKTDPITITVVKGSSQPKDQEQASTVNVKEIADNVFVKAIADKNRVYKGEQVLVTFKLYSRLSITGIYTSKVSQQEGFWTEELETDPKGAPSVEVLDGKRFQVYTLKKIAVFPSKTGELVITSNEFKIPVLIQKKKQGGGSLFDDFFNDPFFGRNEVYEYDTKSNKVSITSIPLPDSNVPESFKGAVGEFSLTSELIKGGNKTNEPFTLKVEISGSGNIALLNVPELKLGTGFEVYEPKSTDNMIRSGSLSGKKSIDYLIIPRTSGIKEIPQLEFSYFSPSKKNYVTLKTPPYKIDIQQGDIAANQSYSGKEEIRVLSDDIRFIKTSGKDIQLREGLILNQSGFWAAVIIPLIAFGGVLVWRRRTDKLHANLELLRYQKAEKIAKNRFRNASKHLKAGDQVNFYSEISLALSGYLEDKFHIPKAELTIDRITEELNSRRIDKEIISKIRSCMERSEFFRFAPQKDGLADMNNMYSEMTNVIVGIEKSLSGGRGVK